MTTHKVAKEHTFRDESISKVIRWDGFEEDIAEAGFPSDAVVEILESDRHFSFEVNGKEYIYKIYAVKSNVYNSRFIGCYVRFSNHPEVGVTSIPLSRMYAESISKNMKVNESCIDIESKIIHYRESLIASKLVRSRYFIKRIAEWAYRKCRYYKGSIIFSFITAVVSSGYWNWNTILKCINVILENL